MIREIYPHTVPKKERQTMRRHVLSLVVENTSGVVSHISGLFSRRAFNMDSFTAGITSDPRFTRVTIAVNADERELDQIKKQLAKLEDVIDIKELYPESSVCRELMLVKIKVDESRRGQLITATEIFRGKITDVANDSLIVELTGDQRKLDAFMELLSSYEILEIARTGITGLTRGTKYLKIYE